MEKPPQRQRARRRTSHCIASPQRLVALVICILALTFLIALSFSWPGDYKDFPGTKPQTTSVRRSVHLNPSLKEEEEVFRTPSTSVWIDKKLLSENVVKTNNAIDKTAARTPSGAKLSADSESPGNETEVIVHENPGTLQEAPFATSGHDGGPFITKLKKLSYCHYEVKNFCVINGTLTFFHEGGARFKKGLRACNEFSRHSPSIYIKYWSSPRPSNDSATLPAPLNTIKKGWILQFWCQDLFHMTLSLLPAFQTKVDIAQEDPDVYIRIARGRRHKGGYCNVKLGDPRNFENSRNAKYGQDKQFPFAGNPYWAFYRILTKYPEKIHPLVPNQSIQTACYQHGVIDKRYIKSMMGSEARNYSTSVLKMMNVTPGQTPPCGGKYRVTLIDRRGRTRRLTNVAEILEVARSVGMEAQSVAFETIPLREQLRLVTMTDVLLGVHGNGLMWQQFLPPGSAVIELVGVWYTPYSLLWGHSYFHSRMVNNREYTRRGEFVPFAHNLTEVRELLLAAKKALDGTRCASKPYEPPNKPLSMLYVNCTPHC